MLKKKDRKKMAQHKQDTAEERVHKLEFQNSYWNYSN